MAGSPYSFRALKTYGNHYARIEEIANFTEEQAFSAECQFYLTGNNDGILISHDGGMCLYLEGDTIYFKGSEESEPIEITGAILDGFMTITVTFDSNTYVFYLNGYKITKKTASQPVKLTSGKGVTIGQGIKGYFSYVRLYKVCLSPESVFAAAYGNPEQSTLLGWFDFTGKQIVDKGPNKIEVCAKGLSCLYTLYPAFRLNGNNYAYLHKSAAENNNSSFTIMGKINLGYCTNENMTIFTNQFPETKKGICVKAVQKQTESNQYYLCVKISSQEFYSENTIELDEWTDFCVVVMQDKIILYVGEIETAFSLKEIPDVLSQEGIAIGVSLDNRQAADYDTAMKGYISYIAEFDTALTAEQIKKYMKNPPYYYDPNLIANYAFYNDSAVDIKSGQEIGFYGKGGGITYLEDARADKLPEIFSIYIPEDEDPEWKTYSEDEKWQIQWMAKMLEESYTILFGGTCNTCSRSIAWYQRAASVFRRFTRRRYYVRLMGMTPSISTRSFMQWLNSFMPNDFRFLMALFRGNTELDMSLKIITGTSLVVAAYPLSKGLCISIGSKSDRDIQYDTGDRPNPPPTPSPELKDLQLRLKSIKYNHQSDGTTGGIHIKLKQGMESQIPEWKSNINLEKNPAVVAIVREDIRKLRMEVTVQAFLKNLASAETSISLRFIHPITGKAVEIKSNTFTVTDLEIKTIILDVPISKNDFPDYTGKYTICVHWRYSQLFYKTMSYMGNTFTKLYVLYQKPVYPLICEYKTEYDSKKSYPSEYAMDISIKLYQNGKKRQTKDVKYLHPEEVGIAARITEGLNDSICDPDLPDYKYDTVNGASRYIMPDPTDFRKVVLDTGTYLTESQDSDATYQINCMDCAFIIQYECGVQGVELSVTKMTSVYNYIDTNPIIPIGEDESGWQYPFQGGFSFHAVAVDFDQTMQTPPYYMRIYDACLKLDFGQYPSAINKEGSPLVPIDLSFSDTNSTYVNITEPYEQFYYRERLIKNGTPCEIFSAMLNAAPGEDRFGQIIDSHFHVSEAIENVSLLQDKISDAIITFPEEVVGRYSVCETKQELKGVLVQMLSLVTNPTLSVGPDLGIGDICYTNENSDSFIIFTRNNYVVYLLRRKEGVDVFAYAKELDDSLK
ncbi:LamG domain-containing protein [Mediterraneibacter gnavus]|uniref:LamG domain-containing protein n=1 Tax=Mediterraneibacter gnavus TaxID=33038 RepID=UPI001185EFDC|nr:LamG domain-containing protein [Mediterraneibacter gnavus]